MADAANEEAAAIIAELLMNALSSLLRKEHKDKAIEGDPTGLYLWERAAVLWLREFHDHHPEFYFSGWSADIVRNADIERYENMTIRKAIMPVSKQRR